MKQLAKFKTCLPDTPENRAEHEWRDNCWGCAPFWWEYPICPTHNDMLTKTGWCRKCRKHYDIGVNHVK